MTGNNLILAIDPGNIQSGHEKWADIKGYEGIYQVSTSGRVKSLPRVIKQRNAYTEIEKYHPGQTLRQSTEKDGYKVVSLCNHGKRKTGKVHRLVAEAFIQNSDNLPEVNHKDGNKANNSVNNLEWCTSSQNRMHAYRTGLQKPPVGEKMPNCKPVEMLENGKVVARFGSVSAACLYLGLKKTAKSDISRCCKGKTSKSHGYGWRFA